MPVNRNALIRYKTIDKCLQNHYRRWTLEDLIDACSDALYEYEGITKGISKRTIQLDIQMMRSDKLGYNAPIVAYDNRYYKYEDENYSITNIPLTDQDLAKLSEAVEFMKQFKGFSHFQELGGMVQKLEDIVYSQKTSQKPVIDFEKNENLKGLEFLDTLYKAIINKKVVTLTYQSFKARQPGTFDFHAYILKEFRNRWFLIGRKSPKNDIMNLALDRIIDITETDAVYRSDPDFNADSYFKNAIGVSVTPNLDADKVVLFVTHKHAPYVLTKPLHHSQKLVDRDSFGITIELAVQHNFELEKEILGFGDGIMVKAPERLKRNIHERLASATESYSTDISEKGIFTVQKKLENRGFAVIHKMFPSRALRQLGSILHKSRILLKGSNAPHHIPLGSRPDIEIQIINKNVKRLLSYMGAEIEPKSLMFFPNALPELFEWQQSQTSEVFSMVILLQHSKFDSFPISVIPGSHKKSLSTEQQQLIIENSSPAVCDIYAGSAFLFKPLLLKQLSNELKNKGVKAFIVTFE